MKTLISTLCLCAAATLPTAAQDVSVPVVDAPSANYAVVERGSYHKIWARTIWERDPAGRGVARTNSYIELASGMHYQRDGVWTEAKEEIEAFPGGAVARQGQHQVIFANNLATVGAIDLQAPDGKRFRSHIIGLSYCDSVTGTNVLIAEIKNCQGKIIAPNQVLYEDAFTDIKASVRYTYEKATFEQDVILEECPPAPEAYGLSSATAKLQVLTEFIDPEPPAKVRGAVATAEGGLVSDEVLDFGATKIGHGKAFFLGQSPQARAVPVTKQWVEWENRHFLVEEVWVPAFQKELETLPRAEGASVEPATNSVRHVVSAKRLLPAPRLAGKASFKQMELASLAQPARGLVLDYVSQFPSTTNFVFQGDLTYYVTGPLYLSGQTIVEGGSVIKLPVSTTASIVTSNLVCATRAYFPAVFTASDDNAHGETISGSTGNPSGKYYGKIALDLSSAATAPVLSNVRFCYLSNALAGSGITLQNAQLLQCKNGFAPGRSQPTLYNVLLYRLNSLAASTGLVGDTVTGINVTAHYCTNFLADTTGTINLTNCLFVGVSSWQCTTTRTNFSVFLDSDAGVFQSLGAGGHYLAEGSPYRNTGTLSIPASLLADLKKKTTYPPLVYSNTTFSTDTTFSPQAQRDTDTPDLGAHYDPLDYAFGGATANANLTFSPGTAVGWFRASSGWYHAGHGIHLADLKRAVFDGRVDAPTWWVRCNTVQESVNGIWAGGYGDGGMTGWAASTATAPTIQARFLRCAMLGGEAGSGNHFRDDNGWLTVRAADCEFLGGSLGAYATSYYHTNCLFERATLVLEAGQVDIAYALRNCTFRGGALSINRYANPTPVSVRDCIFDGTTFPVTDSYAYNSSLSDYNYNAFLSGAPRLTNSGPNNLIVSGSFNWQSGPLGSYYLPSNSSLINAGSVSDAALAGLYHYTTTTNLVSGWQVKELHSRMDIGLHYVAVDAQGNAIDSDGDGMPDYLEDRNGNGDTDGAETGWSASYNSPNGLEYKVKPFTVFTPLK